MDGITHYCVANMPGAVPRTSTRALTNATLPLPASPRSARVEERSTATPGCDSGLNTQAGSITHDAVAAAFA